MIKPLKRPHFDTRYAQFWKIDIFSLLRLELWILDILNGYIRQFLIIVEPVWNTKKKVILSKNVISMFIYYCVTGMIVWAIEDTFTCTFSPVDLVK